MALSDMWLSLHFWGSLLRYPAKVRNISPQSTVQLGVHQFIVFPKLEAESMAEAYSYPVSIPGVSQSYLQECVVDLEGHSQTALDFGVWLTIALPKISSLRSITSGILLERCWWDPFDGIWKSQRILSNTHIKSLSAKPSDLVQGLPGARGGHEPSAFYPFNSRSRDVAYPQSMGSFTFWAWI